MLMEWSWTTIMTVRSDGCTRRHMSVLCSSNVQLKLLLCVNKEDRKWQFGSSNQECHSQLHPLPASDTLRGRRGHGSDSSFSLSLHPVSYLLPFVCFTGHSISMPPTPCITVKEKTEWCTEDTSQSDGSTFFEYSNKTQGLSCQITLTPSVKIPATSPWSREADVLSLPSSSGQSCQDLLVKDTEDSTDGKNDLSEVQLVSLSGISFMRGNNKLCCKCCWSIHPQIIPSAPNNVYIVYLHYLINLVPVQ